MKRTLTSLLLTICFCGAAFGQDDADDKTRKLLAAAAKNGRPINSEITVNGNVHVQAVLIPRNDAKRIFGSEIANNYAVVEINVGNKSPDAALIIHGVFVDYSRWPVSGATRNELNADRSENPYQESAFSTQVASEEYRLVRGQLLDAQTDTWRNRVLRYLTWAGNLAGAFQFSIGEQGFIRGIAAANGVGIPGFATAFPDKTVDQLNRISDLGFRSNKVIPKQASDVIVCFFPIDRFLTPGFRRIYLKSPALFFAPLLMLADKSVERDAQAVIGEMFDGDVTLTTLKQALPCYMTLTRPESPGYLPCVQSFGLEPFRDPAAKETRLRVKLRRDATGKEFKDKSGNLVPDADALKKFKTLMILEFLKNLSLNRATITLDGVMAVNINEVAARVDDVQMTTLEKCGDQHQQCFWTDLTLNEGVRKGSITGAYLKGAKVTVIDASAHNIEEVTTLDAESGDDTLRFSFKLKQPLKSQTKIHFAVSKEEKIAGANTPKKLESNTYEYLVDYATSAPRIDTAVVSAGKLTLTGTRFAPDSIVTLRSTTGKEITVPADAVTVATNTIEIDRSKVSGLKGGCWDAVVQANGAFSNHSQKFPVAATPTIGSATITGNVIEVRGTDLFNGSGCGQEIVFKLKDVTTGTFILLSVAEWGNEDRPVVLRLPEQAKKEGFKGEVHVFLNGADTSNKPLTSQ